MTTHEYLRDVSADILSLNIGSGIARSIQRHSAGPVVEAANGKLAILGLDFGTAFTKAVVQWGRLHYAVDWSPVVLGEDPYLLASVFSEHLDGECVLGAFEGEDWAVRDGIKMRLLAASSGSAEVDLTDAVIFLSLAFRHANRWLRQTRGASNDEIRWRLHVGLPAQSWDDRGITTSFKSVAHAARLAASAPGKVTRRSASKALAMAHLVKQPAVDVFPEFACQLYSYLGSSERQDDLHALVDIGAGTIDVAFFNVFVRDGERLLPIFSAGVEKLGAHYMIAALAGQRGVEVDWHDRESSMSDAEIAQKIGDTIESVAKRRSLFLSAVADLFNANRQRARDVYETSPAFKGLATVRLFICGGGSRISAFRKHFHRIQAESATLLRLNFLVSDLVRPQNIVGNFGVNFDRLSVAYGLSQLGINIGNVMRSADLKPLRASVAEGSKHRDDDR